MKKMPQLMVQKVPTRSVMLAREMVEAIADSSGQEVTKNSVPAFFAAGLDFFRLILIEIGHLEPDVGEEGHPLIRQHLDALRATWADDDTEQALLDARKEVAYWKAHSERLDQMYSEYIASQQDLIEEGRRSIQEKLALIRGEHDDVT